MFLKFAQKCLAHVVLVLQACGAPKLISRALRSVASVGVRPPFKMNIQSMNGNSKLTVGYATIVMGNIATTNITTDDINFIVGGGRSLSVFDDLKKKEFF